MLISAAVARFNSEVANVRIQPAQSLDALALALNQSKTAAPSNVRHP